MRVCGRALLLCSNKARFMVHIRKLRVKVEKGPSGAKADLLRCGERGTGLGEKNDN